MGHYQKNNRVRALRNGYADILRATLIYVESFGTTDRLWVRSLKMDIVVVNAASGVGLTTASENIAKALRSPLPGARGGFTVEIADVEAELKRLYRLDHPHDAEISDTAPMQDILLQGAA